MTGAAPRQLRLISFKELRKGVLIGFATVELPIGLKIVDCPVCISHGKAWASLPSKPQINRDGQVIKDDRGRVAYANILDWRDRALRDGFSERVVELVRAQHPDLFEVAAA